MRWLIEWLKKQWREVFYKDEPFFKFDGWFGWDKIGHFATHAICVAVSIWLYAIFGTLGFILAIALYDTIFDIIYEYKDYCRGNGFSLMDVAYGRLACFTTLYVACYLRIL